MFKIESDINSFTKWRPLWKSVE